MAEPQEVVAWSIDGCVDALGDGAVIQAILIGIQTGVAKEDENTDSYDCSDDAAAAHCLLRVIKVHILFLVNNS
jgi:hypothetical protein